MLVSSQIFAVDTQQAIEANVNQPKKYSNIIFDVGNVLLEWNPAKIIAAVNAKKSDWNLDIELIRQVTDSEIWAKWDAGDASKKDIENTILPARLDRNAFEEFLNVIPEFLTPLQEGIDILKAVKAREYHVYILSNMPKENVDIIKRKNDFFSLCDGEVFSCDAHAAKPAPAIYQTILQKYKLNPAECLFIDDVSQNIDAAKTAGIDGIICSSHAFVKNELKRLFVLE